jgi:hypothetical protein
MSATPPEGAIPQATVTQLPVDAMPVDTPPATVSGTELPLPDEPWYRDKPEHYDECVAPLPTIPAQHFPAPFSACDPRVESFTSPPGGNELHFHYREFSASLTAQRSTASTATCCYMIFEFPRRD